MAEAKMVGDCEMAAMMTALWNWCGDCRQHLNENFDGLVHSFASVGIEEGESSDKMAEIYFEGYHNRGHKPRA